jgi:hypothetical protein
LNQNMQTEFSRMREYLNQLYHPQSFRHDWSDCSWTTKIYEWRWTRARSLNILLCHLVSENYPLCCFAALSFPIL